MFLKGQMGYQINQQNNAIEIAKIAQANLYILKAIQ